jgi:hypothetical protein
MITVDIDFRSEHSWLMLQAQSHAYRARVARRNLCVFATRFALPVRRPCALKYSLTLVSFSLLLSLPLAKAVELKADTIQAWNACVRAAQMRMEDRAKGKAPFMWLDEQPNLTQRVLEGAVLVEPMDGESPRPVPSGLIHDWIGAVFIPKSSLDDVMAVLDDYQHYKDFYRPMVVESRLLDQSPGHQKVTLLMVQKALSVTGAVEADDDVKIARVGADRVYSTSISVRVQEIADYGKPSEHMLPENHGPGYVWRTFNITRLEQRDDGVCVEMEILALSRSIPVLFRWLVEPLAERLPRNIVLATLQDTRGAVSKEIKETSLKSRGIAQETARR